MALFEHIWSRVKSWFHDEDEMTLDDKLAILHPGDMVSIKFRDLGKLGFLDPAAYASSRFDAEDFKTRLLQGQVTAVNAVSELDGFMYFELQVVKLNGTVRKYVLIEDEVEELEFLTSKHTDGD